MRPKLIALLAVPALALAGCAGGEQAQTTSTELAKVDPSPVESAAPKAKSASSAKAKSSAPTEFTEVEKQFLSFVESRATVHTTKIGVSDRTVIESFDGYCDEGKQMDVSDNEELNENLEVIAESTFCDMRD